MLDPREQLQAIDFNSSSWGAEDVLKLVAFQVPTILRHMTEFDDGRLWLGPIPRLDHPHHIRAHLEAAHMLSVLVGRPELCTQFRRAGFFQESHDRLTEILARAIDTACAYHVTDGSWTLPNMPKPWGDGWQTALWTYRLARAIWEAADRLRDDVVSAARRVIAHEADRFVGVEPPSGCLGDTKLEENAWDAMLLAWAPLACPGHPRAAAWELAAKTWAANAMVRPVDHFDRSWMDGRQVAEWLTATTLFPDFTCENHGTFHVGYQACVVENAWAALAYVASGRDVPPQFTRNMREVEEILLWLNFEDSAQMMVTGNDWTSGHGVHQSTPVSAYFTRTPRALKMARANFALCRDLLLRSENGHIFGDTLDENVGDQRWFFHTCNTAWLADAIYALPLPDPLPGEAPARWSTAETTVDPPASGVAAPPSAAMAAADLASTETPIDAPAADAAPHQPGSDATADRSSSDALPHRAAADTAAGPIAVKVAEDPSLPIGVKTFPYVEVITHRNRDRLASAAWRSQYKHPLFTAVPVERSNWQSWAPFTGIGRLEAGPPASAEKNLERSALSVKVRTHAERETPLGFVTSGAVRYLNEDGAWAEQCLAWAVVDESGTLLLVDCIKALRPVCVNLNEGLMFSVANDFFNGYARRVAGESGSHSVRALTGVLREWELGERATFDDLLTIVASAPLMYRAPGRRLQEDNRFKSTQYDRIYSPFKKGWFREGEVVRAGAWIFTFEPNKPWESVHVEIDAGVCRARACRGGAPLTAELRLVPPFDFTIFSTP